MSPYLWGKHFGRAALIHQFLARFIGAFAVSRGKDHALCLARSLSLFLCLFLYLFLFLLNSAEQPHLPDCC